ncbi:MAG: hypothetical protein IIA59_02795 [Candidatus Marinimicrobia bacterium]|nr:hypothetical protein [Candidatus Neomarinimicrobiota bacterium]
MYLTALLVLHIILVAIMAGATLLMAVLWWRTDDGEAAQAARLPAMLEVSSRATVPAGTGLVLAGILTLLARPALLTGSMLLTLKIALGLVTVGVALVLHRKLQAGIAEPRSSASDSIGTLVQALAVLLTIVVALSIMAGFF